MTAPQEKAIREALPVVAWRYVPSRIWNDVVLTDDASRAALAVEMGRPVDELVLKSDAESQLAELRAEVEGLKATITEHNSDCVQQCEARKASGPSHCPMKGYHRNCSDCPRDGMVDAAIENGGANV